MCEGVREEVNGRPLADVQRTLRADMAHPPHPWDMAMSPCPPRLR